MTIVYLSTIPKGHRTVTGRVIKASPTMITVLRGSDAIPVEVERGRIRKVTVRELSPEGRGLLGRAALLLRDGALHLNAGRIQEAADCIAAAQQVVPGLGAGEAGRAWVA